MAKELNEERITQLLSEQIVGRIGCHADGVTYIVPVTYVYDGEFIYAHSKEGMKTTIMNKNPDVCFQVDEILNLATWWSVVIWGRFEEIHGDEREKAIKLLIEKIMTLLEERRSLPAHGAIEHAQAAAVREAIWYRIRIINKTGRYEIN
ncbi:pyridoxamine 5'-phosphate oxidase family protein [Mucilaginibacter sp. P25]|uniref:Pyridoxamine 5'-phosphate oxidase family protein n=1 Tax=Mucilaginibacter gossypii TaxID=551996 RepID=A0A1G7U3D7_9SPHI|nr:MULTISPECIES: pyridoxamine 5'-phosphate oxidase family protein [Mucilaginibacter]QTE38857.1 pyridoxamine 5'-phosphate oxidase family protein [Mucilaginibacter gossypii]RAV55068.1 pyridoxamine 5'-phosphate oxidase family protein [Mucilaginibacter rubeus]SDG41914.1 hypothetical protein SAMN05192573_103352 [Mucilaginibacter gossypii]